MAFMTQAQRLIKISKELNVGISTLVDFLKAKGHVLDPNPNTKVSEDLCVLLTKEFSSEKKVKAESSLVDLAAARKKKETVSASDLDTKKKPEDEPKSEDREVRVKVVGKIDIDALYGKKKQEQPARTQPVPAPAPAQKTEPVAEAPKPKPAAEPVPAPVAEIIEPKAAPVQPAPEPAPEPLQVKTPVAVSEEPAISSQQKIEAPIAPVKRDFEGDGGNGVEADFSEDANDSAGRRSAPSDDDQSENTQIPMMSNTPDSEAQAAPERDGIFTANTHKIENNVKVVGKIDLTSLNQKTRPDRKSKVQKERDRRDRARDAARPTPPAGNQGQGQNQNSGQSQNQGQNQGQGNSQNQGQGHGNNQNQGSNQGQRPNSEQPRNAEPPRPLGPRPVQRYGPNDPRSAGNPPLPPGSAPLSDAALEERKKRDRIKKENRPNVPEPAKKPGGQGGQGGPDAKPAAGSANKAKGKGPAKKGTQRGPVSDQAVNTQMRETLSRIGTKSKNKSVKYRKDKRDAFSQRQQEEQDRILEEQGVLKVTEFVTVSEIASMMDVPATEIIGKCMSIGMFVSINQRIDAETIKLIASEYGFEVEFVSVDIQEAIEQEADSEETLIHRPPIVTVMGHVDHGKTSLLDYIRKANVIAGEAGGITQHIGAYSVQLPDGRKITFLDTPGHEAFTAMRARGAQITDIAIIVIAADDSIMPQTIEAINHASAAGVPMVFAINKIDKQGALPEKIKEALANMNILVEDWGGKYQSQEISAKKGINVYELLEKVLLEAEILELKANPEKRAVGTVVESQLDKGRGYVATMMVQAGSLKVGDFVLAGSYYGRVKAMFNERNQRVEHAGPSEPVLILGLNGAPQAGDKFNVMESEREAKEIATKREQLQREQDLKTRKHLSLDEIGRRIAIGNFQQMNVIVKGDVDGSIEALADSILKLSTSEIQINVIHKAVGQVTESDIMLASASDAIIIGFQVRPSMNARKLAEKEGIDIRLYSIIYDAINDLKSAMTGMLKPEFKEKITGTLEIREVFKVSKVGTIAGCYVIDGKVTRHSHIRLIRDGIVVFTGELGSLKRFKDDVKEVTKNFECGLNIHNFNDIKEGDLVEAFETIEVQRTL